MAHFIKIVFLTVLCTQFGAVSGYECAANEVEVFGNGYRVFKYFSYGFTIVSSKVADGIMIWC